MIFFAWLLTDPVTAVGAAPLAEAPRVSELPALIKAKYATSVNRWTILLRQPSPVRLLSEATGGELARSRIWREVMSRYGVSDVASAVFADQYGCWGFLDLWRHRARGPFDAADADFLATLTAPLARALRRCQARTFIEPAAAHRYDAGPVVLTLDDGLRMAGCPVLLGLAVQAGDLGLRQFVGQRVHRGLFVTSLAGLSRPCLLSGAYRARLVVGRAARVAVTWRYSALATRVPSAARLNCRRQPASSPARVCCAAGSSWSKIALVGPT